MLRFFVVFLFCFSLLLPPAPAHASGVARAICNKTVAVVAVVACVIAYLQQGPPLSTNQVMRHSTNPRSSTSIPLTHTASGALHQTGTQQEVVQLLPNKAFPIKSEGVNQRYIDRVDKLSLEKLKEFNPEHATDNCLHCAYALNHYSRTGDIVPAAAVDEYGSKAQQTELEKRYHQQYVRGGEIDGEQGYRFGANRGNPTWYTKSLLEKDGVDSKHGRFLVKGVLSNDRMDHAWFAYVKNGKIRHLDPQNGIELNEHFQKTHLKGEYVSLTGWKIEEGDLKNKKFIYSNPKIQARAEEIRKISSQKRRSRAAKRYAAEYQKAHSFQSTILVPLN